MNVSECPEEMKIRDFSEKGLCPMEEDIPATKYVGDSEAQEEPCLDARNTVGVDKRGS